MEQGEEKGEGRRKIDPQDGLDYGMYPFFRSMRYQSMIA